MQLFLLTLVTVFFASYFALSIYRSLHLSAQGPETDEGRRALAQTMAQSMVDEYNAVQRVLMVDCEGEPARCGGFVSEGEIYVQPASDLLLDDEL